MGLKILITGGAGYLGTILCEELLKLPEVEKIIILDNLLYKQEGLFSLLYNKKLEFICEDVTNFNLLEKIILNVDVIFPLAALVGGPACNQNKEMAKKINQNQLEFITNNCAYNTKIIYPNTNSLYGQTDGLQHITEKSPVSPISVYGWTKYEGEKSVLKYGGIVLRLATVFGTSYRFRKDLLVNDFVLRALTDKFIVLFEPHFKRNYIHVRDVSLAFIHMMRNYGKYKGEVFNLGLSSANLSKLELCEIIKKHIPDFVIKIDEFSKDPDKRNYIVSNKKMEKTGWLPRHSLDDGIQELIKAYPVLINSGLTTYTNL